jgi:hypothetical protein
MTTHTHLTGQHSPVVYYLASQFGGVVKIGTTVNVTSRVARLERAQPALKGRIMATEPGDRHLEAERHQQFRHAHQVGEWYWLTPDLVEHIEHIAGGVL